MSARVVTQGEMDVVRAWANDKASPAHVALAAVSLIDEVVDLRREVATLHARARAEARR